MSEVVASLRSVLGSIDSIISSKSITHPVRLLAVSKTKPHTMVQDAFNAGQIHFGENYVNELVEKAPLCPIDIKWHFIGHLQSNKAAKLLTIPNLYMVECIDSIKLAQKLNTAVEKANRNDKLNILIQVNTSGEESKSGCQPQESLELFTTIVETCKNLRICGLMTIGKYEAEPSTIYFDELNSCKQKIFEKYPNYNTSEWVMSMGMSHDMKLAIENGSTEVRVGTAIFGPREYVQRNDDD